MKSISNNALPGMLQTPCTFSSAGAHTEIRAEVYMYIWSYTRCLPTHYSYKLFLYMCASLFSALIFSDMTSTLLWCECTLVAVTSQLSVYNNDRSPRYTR